jgi:hypothetical protein
MDERVDANMRQPPVKTQPQPHKITLASRIVVRKVKTCSASFFGLNRNAWASAKSQNQLNVFSGKKKRMANRAAQTTGSRTTIHDLTKRRS